MRKMKVPKMRGVKNMHTPRSRKATVTRTTKVRKTTPRFTSQGLGAGRFRRKKSASSKAAVRAHDTRSMRKLHMKGF